MENLILNKQALLKGETVSFETVNKDDPRTAEIDFNTKKQEFRIFFNGTFIWIGKAFPALQASLNKLHATWNLEPANETIN